MNRIIRLLLCLLLLGTSMAHASIFLTLGSGYTDNCDQVKGTWKGDGKISWSSFFTSKECTYSGIATVNPGKDSHHFSMDVEMTEKTGSCPDHEKFNLVGICQDNQLTFESNNAELAGQLTNQGKTARVNGTVSFTYYGLPLTANVDEMTLNKQD